MPCLIAHRGQSVSIPENTIESIMAAIECGASAVEFDIQMTSDGIPVLSHDLSLLKTAGVDLKLSEINYADVKNISVNEADRFGEIYQSVSLPSLSDAVSMLRDIPQVMVFVELKEESIKNFGIVNFLRPVLEQLGPIRNRCVLIADNLEALVIARKSASFSIGWIIHDWDADHLWQAKKNAVDYMVINHRYCDAVNHDYASDDWEWVMYETCDADKAIALFNKGVNFVESDDICSMLKQVPDHLFHG